MLTEHRLPRLAYPMHVRFADTDRQGVALTILHLASE
jgi:hypothetical protein